MTSGYRKLTTICLAAVLAFGLAACGGGGDTAMPEPEPTPYQQAVAGIAAATTAAAAQAAYDAVKDDVTAAQGAELQAAVDARVAALAMMGRAAEQRQALMTAAGNIDTSDLSTQAAVNAAEAAIAALKAALAAAADVSDADKAMYQGRVTAAETAVATAQSALDHATQTAALSSAVTALQGIDLTDLSTQDKIDAAEEAIAAVRTALEAATELSAAEKTMAMTELATADRTVMMAQGRFDTDAQKTALAEAVATLAALDLGALMTQDDIDAAEAAIVALDLALAAATNLTDAEKLDATVDVTVAKRRVASAQTALDTNVGNQRMALTEAGTALAAIDLADLDTQAKIEAANTAVMALKAALDDATHLSDSEKAMYQTQLDTATETVRTAQTGMDRDGRMMAQRTAITSAVTMARTAVAGVSDDSTDSEVAAADAAIAALKAAIEGAEDLPEGDTDVAAARGTLATLEPQLAAAKTSRMAAMEEADEQRMKDMAATGKALRAALGGPEAGGNALANIGATTLAATGTMPLSIPASEAGAGALAATATTAAVDLRTGASAGSLGGWAGTNYARTTGTGDARVTSEARVYVNKGPGRSRAFSGTGGKYTLIAAGSAQAGYLLLGETDTPVTLAGGPAFMHSGTQTHQVPAESDAFYVSGTYDGAPGRFRCATGCSSTNDGTGNVSALAGTWHFKPDAGAMVMEADAHYLYYGWWVSKDNDGDPTVASAFTGRVGTDPGDSTDGLDTAVAGNTLTGSASYAGHAAGKFAISNPLDSTGNGGHFTADAELMATFGTVTAAGMTGTIDNFRLNDGSEDPGWSVSLHRAGWGADGAITAPTDDAATTDVNEAMGTTWSIGDNSGGRTGTWSGQMYDEKPGDPSATGPGDGSNIPTTVTGTFYSEFSTIGRMVGAFGADKQ